MFYDVNFLAERDFVLYGSNIDNSEIQTVYNVNDISVTIRKMEVKKVVVNNDNLLIK